MAPLSLGRPKWGGSHLDQGGPSGMAPRRKLPPRGRSFLPPSLVPHQWEGNPRAPLIVEPINSPPW